MRRMDQTARNFKPPPHAAGKSANQRVFELEQIHVHQQIVNDLLAFLPGNAVEFRVDLHILDCGKLRIGSQRLGNHAHGEANSVCIGANIVPGDARGAGGRRRKRRHHANQSGFSRAVRAQQAENLLLRDIETDVVDGHQLAELFREMFNFD